MWDAVMLASTLVFFWLAFSYTTVCEELRNGKDKQ